MHNVDQIAQLVHMLLASHRVAQTTCVRRLMVVIEGLEEHVGDLILYAGSSHRLPAGVALEVRLVIDVDGQWVPYDTISLQGGGHIVAKLDMAEGKLHVSDPIVEEEEGREPADPPWPEPTVDEPDFETLEEWLWEDGGCEATDGCWTDPDATCPHGHPSWLLRFGLI